jgi:hypothetical protein
LPYWDDVRKYWAESEMSIGEQPAGAARATMKPMWPISVRRPTTPIAVTGLRGAGKTLLYDTLLGKVRNDYVPPGRSDTYEKHRSVIKSGETKVRAATVVVPGQRSDPRSDALERMFAEGRSPAGVIHVVCWGYNRIWEAGERQAVSDQIAAGSGNRADLAAIRDWNLREELSDFTETCELLKNAWERKSRVWLIIAVTKCDLFWPERTTARDYYIPGRPARPAPDEPPRESEFCEELRSLVRYVGESNCDRLAVLPVSCYPEEYKFDGITQSRAWNISQTSASINQFRGVVGEFCAR